MRRIWLLLGIALLGAILALGAIACGDDDEGDDGGSPTATEQAAEPTSPSEEPTSPGGQPTSAPGAFTTVVASENPLGTILTTFDGYTLYTFDSDSGGVPTCTGDCATTWPPLVIPGAPTAGEGVSGTLDLVARDDGSMQVTLDGKPLYMYSGDPAVGDTNGDGFGGVWHVVTLG